MNHELNKMTVMERNGLTRRAISGFYFFATTGVLSSCGNYSIDVNGYGTVTQKFSWSGSEMTLNFALT